MYDSNCLYIIFLVSSMNKMVNQLNQVQDTAEVRKKL